MLGRGTYALHESVSSYPWSMIIPSLLYHSMYSQSINVLLVCSNHGVSSDARCVSSDARFVCSISLSSQPALQWFRGFLYSVYNYLLYWIVYDNYNITSTGLAVI